MDVVASIGLGLFFPVEQEITRVVAARVVSGDGALPVLRRGAALAFGLLSAVLLPTRALRQGSSPTSSSRGHRPGGRAGRRLRGAGRCALTRGILAGLGRFGAYGTQLAVDGRLRIVLAAGGAVFGLHSALAFSLVLAVAPVIATLVTLPTLLRAFGPGEPIAGGSCTADWAC